MAECHERSILAMRRCYTLFNQQGLTVDFARSCDLKNNPLGIRVLVLPFAEGLSEAELDQVEAFAQAGGRVYRFLDDGLGFEPFQRNPKTVLDGVVSVQHDTATLLTAEKLHPVAQLIDAEHADVRLLQGDGFLMAVLTNYDPLERPIHDTLLRLPGMHFTQVTAYATDLPDEGEPLHFQGDTIYLPTLSWGAFVIISQGRK